MHRAGDLAKRALDFRVADMADQHDVETLFGVAAAFLVHLGDQRAGRVDDVKLAHQRAVFDLSGDAMGGKTVTAPVGTSSISSTKIAPRAQRVDDALVVNNLMADIDRRAVVSSARSTMSIARSTPAQNPVVAPE
ncbi:MAG: hypothetical protein R3C40_12110 [Parvularculaceae bacterium]